ncbi:MAG: hypothetical protein KKD73_04790 [Proteobacteria bacterium]|nr:hypothetical protein [Pseudomonadota bacterium]MBU1639398.1 hypothetical protein [Pseudomonadota bacterium]
MKSGDLSQQLYEHMFAQCLAMAKYAFSSGLQVDGVLVQFLEKMSCCQMGSSDLGEYSAPPQRQKKTDHHETLHPPYETDIAKLATVHWRLSQIIKPAKPSSVMLLEEAATNRSFLHILGPLPFVRQMMMTALLSTLAFILISLSSMVDASPEAGNVLTSSGLQLLYNELFFLSAAGIGASFAALFKVNRYIVEGTYDPKYEPSYWTRFVLGLIAGLILAELIPLDTGGSLEVLSRPILALLGGFSSSAVYRILNSLVSAVESLVRGGTEDLIKSSLREAEVRFAEQKIEKRAAIATQLLRLQQFINSSEVPDEVRKNIDRIVQNLLPFEENPNLTVDMKD